MEPWELLQRWALPSLSKPIELLETEWSHTPPQMEIVLLLSAGFTAKQPPSSQNIHIVNIEQRPRVVKLYPTLVSRHP